MAKRKNKKYNGFRLTLIIIAIVTIISLVGGITIFTLFSNHNKIDFREYFAFGDRIATVKDDKYQKVSFDPIISDGNLFISYEYVKENIDEYIYWDQNLNKLTITTSEEVIRFKEDETTYFVNDEPFELELSVKILNGEPYLPASLLESLYAFSFEYHEASKIVVVYDHKKEINKAVLKNNSTLRYEHNRKGVIVDKLKKGEKVQIFDQYDDYTKVVISDGRVGYLKTKDINSKSVETIVLEHEITETEYLTTDSKVNLVWDMITNIDANSTNSSRALHEGVNVVSPTWFKFDRNKLDGTVISYADKDYVDYAHANGYMVWGLVSDVADAFDTVVLANILPNSDYREYAIKQLLSYMTIYDLDGLNIDFEVLRPEDSEHYVQFFRELYPYMKKEGKYLSVDTYVPSDWSYYFRREDVAKSVDFFIIMAYDEHNGSTDEGPVASYNFVEKGIKDSLEDIPNEKLILGMPFYTRVWKESIVDGVAQTKYSADLGMDTAIDRFKRNNATFTYDDVSKYTYAEYSVIENGNTVKYKAWLEDKESIEKKVELANKYDLKGVAGWRRGLQGDGIFKLIDKTLNK